MPYTQNKPTNLLVDAVHSMTLKTPSLQTQATKAKVVNP